MGTRLLAGLSLVAIVATACSAAAPPQAEPPPSQAAKPQPAKPRPSPIAELHMVSATDGWARTESGTLTRTTDGGHTWHSVEHCPVDQLLPVGTDELWTAGGPGPDGDVSVCHTTDGGATWQTNTLHVDPDAMITEITAPDAHDMWIESAIPQGMHSDALIGLYRSADAGKTWHEVATAGDVEGDPSPGASGLDPSCGRDVTFVTATTGWSVGGCAQDNGAAPGEPIPQHVQTSTDGGRHWSAQPFSSTTQAAYTSLCTQSEDCVFGDPTFAGGAGVVVCTVGGTIALFTTDDAGHTWDVRNAPAAPPDAQPAVDVVSPQVVLVSVTGTTARTLTETTDAGHTWGNVPLPPTDGSDDWTPDFVSANVGFLSDNTAIEVTTDAGRHWQSIAPIVLK